MSVTTHAQPTDVLLITPIDDIETFILTTNWQYDRLTPHEIVVNFKGSYCEYQITIIWLEHTNILHLAV